MLVETGGEATAAVILSGMLVADCESLLDSSGL